MPNKTQHNLCQKPLQIELNQAESMCEWARTTTRTRQQGQTETGNGRCVLEFVSAFLLLKFNASLFVDPVQEKRIVKSWVCMGVCICGCSTVQNSSLLLPLQMQICSKFIECT